jgi:hypothetical protein
MRFMMLMILKGYGGRAGHAADPKAVAAMMKYNESLQKAGVLSVSTGRIRCRRGRVVFGRQPSVTDGPFAEAKEALGGYWMIQVRSRRKPSNGRRAAPLQTTK